MTFWILGYREQAEEKENNRGKQKTTHMRQPSHEKKLHIMKNYLFPPSCEAWPPFQPIFSATFPSAVVAPPLAFASAPVFSTPRSLFPGNRSLSPPSPPSFLKCGSPVSLVDGGSPARCSAFEEGMESPCVGSHQPQKHCCCGVNSPHRPPGKASDRERKCGVHRWREKMATPPMKKIRKGRNSRGRGWAPSHTILCATSLSCSSSASVLVCRREVSWSL